MSGISFGCIVWCPSAFTSLPGLESFPLGNNGLFHVFIPPPGFTTPMVGPSCTTHLLSCLEQSSLDVVSATPADLFTCKLKTSLKWLLVWGSLSFQTLRRGVKLRLDFGGTSIWSWCCKATSSPGITFTSVRSLCIVLRKRMKSICDATFPDLCVMRWLSCFLKHVFPRSSLNARAYPQHLVPACHTPSHHALPCIQCLHGLHGCSSLHMGSEILMLGSWQSQHAADQRTGP